jgi:single-stranded DNA-specific DHH superfamily exonuclease
MSLEDFLEKDTFNIAAASALLSWAGLVASNNHLTEKEKKYEELQKEVEQLVEKYKVTDDELMGADYDLDAELPEEEELMERADKLVAREEGWY